MGRKIAETDDSVAMETSYDHETKAEKKSKKNKKQNKETMISNGKTAVPVAAIEATPDHPEQKQKKKKKKGTNKHVEWEVPNDDEEKELEAQRKRKLEEVDVVNKEDKKSTHKERNKKNKKKHEETNEDRDELCRVAMENANLTSNIDEVAPDGIAVSGKDVEELRYAAMESFSESKLPEDVLQCCKDFSKPSPIQSRAWPFLLDGRDFIGIAKTGSGKTLAFGVPAIMHVRSKRKSNMSKKMNPLCLVLSPTRELAQQIYDVLCDAGKSCGVKSVCLYGGTSKGPQISSLKSGVDIVIGTPGRLKDLVEMGFCNLAEVSFVVLDEADRMLDMGFEPEVRSILSQTCSIRQTVMFSATWPLPVHQLAQNFMDPDPVKVVVGSEDLAANHDVMQIVEVLDDRARDARLMALLEKYHKSQKNRVLVFVLYKKEAARVEDMLHRKGMKVVSVHGDKAQSARTQALSLFKDGVCPLMVATDVAARGLDIPDVEVVINYSFPLTTEDYVHRIGRTGRAGKKGVAHTFFMPINKGLAGELVNVLREAGQIVPTDLMKFGTHVKKKESKLYGAHFKEISMDSAKSTKITFDNSDDE